MASTGEQQLMCGCRTSIRSVFVPKHELTIWCECGVHEIAVFCSLSICWARRRAKLHPSERQVVSQREQIEPRLQSHPALEEWNRKHRVARRSSLPPLQPALKRPTETFSSAAGKWRKTVLVPWKYCWRASGGRLRRRERSACVAQSYVSKDCANHSQFLQLQVICKGHHMRKHVVTKTIKIKWA